MSVGAIKALTKLKQKNASKVQEEPMQMKIAPIRIPTEQEAQYRIKKANLARRINSSRKDQYTK